MTQVIHNYDIRTPIWNGSAKKRMIGIAINRMNHCDQLNVRILQKDKHGKRIYPLKYKFTKSWFNSYEGEIVSRHGVTLKYFFIEDLTTVPKKTIAKTLSPQEKIFYAEASKYGQFTRHKINSNYEGVVNGKSNTGNNKYKPTRTKI